MTVIGDVFAGWGGCQMCQRGGHWCQLEHQAHWLPFAASLPGVGVSDVPFL
jgi:hypothetical protein